MLESEDEAPSPNDEKDILDSSIYGPNAKLFSCILCDQKFTNKVNSWQSTPGSALTQLPFSSSKSQFTGRSIMVISCVLFAPTTPFGMTATRSSMSDSTSHLDARVVDSSSTRFVMMKSVSTTRRPINRFFASFAHQSSSPFQCLLSMLRRSTMS